MRSLLQSERGMALPTALLATVISFSLATAAIVSSVNSQRGTARDQDSKNAIAAADAGASVGMLRLNRFTGSLSSSNPCVGMNGNTLVVTTTSGDGWCPAVSGSVGYASYSYRMLPQTSPPGAMTIVSTGTAGSVSRRIDVSFNATTVGNVLSLEGVVGQDSITLDQNADIRVSIGTNGDVTVKNNANVCGNIRHGIGKNANFSNNGTQCNGYSITSGNVTLPPVSSFIPADIATNNSNGRLAQCTGKNVPAGCQSDTYSSSWGSTVPWNPATRAISTGNNTTLTLGGGDYFICSLSLSNNSQLIMAAGAQIRLFFDTPEHCNQPSGTVQLNISNNANIQATGYQPSQGQFNVPGIYMMGSPTLATSAVWSQNSGTNEFVLYAPNTDITLNNNATYIGAIAGKTVTEVNNGIVKQDAGFKPPQIGGATDYQRQSYVECTGASASPPNANC